MSFLRNLGKIFSGQPLVLQMRLAPERVHIVVKKGDQTVAHRDLLKNKVIPAVLVKFLEAQPDTYEARYFVTFPLAKRLSEALKPLQSDSFQLETTAIDQLRKVVTPDDFSIHWRFNPTAQLLVQVLNGADGYLGEGWFYRSNSAWKLQDSTAPAVLKSLDKSPIGSRELCKFVTDVFPRFQDLGYKCDLTVESNFQVNLQIIKILKRSVDFQVTSNMPDLQKHLKAIQNDTENLISGNTILPGLAHKLGGKLLRLAQSGEVTRISDNELLAFLQDDLSPVAGDLGVDLGFLKEAFPIDDASGAPVSWKLEYEIVNGIGRYEVVPCVQASGELIPITTLERAYERGNRFLKVGERWLEFTPHFGARSLEWKQRSLRTVRLDPLEIMGARTERLDRLHLAPPHIDTETALSKAQTEGHKARLLMQIMRHHGLPVGVYGLQQEMTIIVGEVCSQLLKENPHVSILWLAPGRQKEEIARSLRQIHVPFNRQRSERGQVLLISPDMLATLEQIWTSEWTLTIFSDLDVTASGDKHARILTSIRREWSICTFSRADWYQNNARAKRVLVALRLDEQALATFRRVCTGLYADQAQGLLSRLISPFRAVTIRSDDADQDTGDVLIPPRPQPASPKPVEPRPPGNTNQVYRPSFTVSESTSSSGSRFLDQAQRYVHQKATATEPVPFMQYWPTYEAMTSAQRNWYFYWRTQVREGKYLPTDLSYLFLHVYEVIHLVGFSSADAGADYLANLWRQYRPIQPKLDKYLVDWIADFHAVYHLSQTPLDWYASALNTDARLSDINLAIEAWLSHNSSIQEIPDSLLFHISDYQPAKSKFVQQHNQDHSIDYSLREGLNRIDQFLQEAAGESLFEQHRPQGKTVIRRRPFASAVYEGNRDEIVIATIPNWSEATGLRTSITAILKYTENLLRRQHSFRGTLRGIEIPLEWSAILDAAFAPASTGGGSTSSIAPIVIDFTKVNELTVESAEVQKRLRVTDEEESQEAVVIPQETVLSVPEPATDAFDLERPADTPDDLLTDLEAVYAVIQGDHETIDLLRYFRQSDWKVQPDAAAAVLNGIFLSVILDRINERALEHFGDQIIFEEGDFLVVTEDYRDELEHLLNQAQVADETPAEVPDYADLTPEWAAFVNRMQPQHWEALNALLLEEDVVARLDGIARSAFTTTDLLIDEINDFALSSLSDIVIETGDIPAIEEEDIEDLRSLMAWAQTNVIQEI